MSRKSGVQGSETKYLVMFHETHNLAGYVEGALEPRAASRVERHLETCAHCRAALADMRAAKRVLNAAGETVKPIHYDSELWSRVHARIATPHRQAPLRPRWALAGGGLALGAAAICLAIMMNLPHPGSDVTQKPNVTGVPGPAGKPTLMAKAPTRLHVKPDLRQAAPVPEGSHHPAPTAAPTPAPQIAQKATPMPPIAAQLAPSPVPHRDKTMVANADTGSVSVPFGASGNQQGNVRTRVGLEAKPTERATFSYKNSAKVDTQNVPSTTGQMTAPSQLDVNGDRAPSQRDKFESTALASGGRRGSALDIVSADAPPVPATVGIAGQVNERALADKVKRMPPTLSPALGMSRMGSAVGRTGASTIEGHRLYAEADSAFREGKDSTANLYYSDAIKLGLDSVERQVSETRLGDLAMKANDATTAVKWYRAAVSRSKDADTLKKLGDALEKSGDAKGAAAAYRQALAINPAFATAKEGLERVKGN